MKYTKLWRAPWAHIYKHIFSPSIYIYGHSIGHEQNLDFLSYLWTPSWSCSFKSAFQTSNCTMDDYPLVKTNIRMIGTMRIDSVKIYVIALVQGVTWIAQPDYRRLISLIISTRLVKLCFQQILKQVDNFRNLTIWCSFAI